MKRYIWLAALVVLFPVSLWAGQVKVYLDETRKDYVMVDKMDCRTHKTKSGVTLGLKAGNMLFSFGPEITLGGEAKARWTEAVQGLVVRYEELCSRFNTGMLTKVEYEKRLEEINVISKEAFDFQESSLKKVREHAKDAFKDLDKEIGRQAAGDDVNKKVEKIAAKVEAMTPLESTGREN